MTLTKRFLHPDFRPFRQSRKQLFNGIAIGILFAVIFYALTYWFREILRVMWIDDIYYDVVILSREEMNFYNLICAYISTIFAQSLVFLFLFNRPRRKYGKYGYKLDSFISVLWPLNLVFTGMVLALIGKAGLIFFWRTEYEFGLYPAFNVYFILMLIVLFLQQWIAVIRVFKRKGIKWMFISAIIISLLSLGMSRINFSNYDAFNREMQSKSIYHNYHVDWPVVDHVKFLNIEYFRDYPDGTIYLVNPKSGPDKKVIALMSNTIFYSDSTLNNRALHEVPTDSIKATVEHWAALKMADTVYHRYYPDIEIYHLKINRDVSMAFVNKMKADLASAGVRKVRYAVLPSNYESGVTFRMYDDWYMLNMFLPEYYSYPPDKFETEFKDAERSHKIITAIQAGTDYIINGELVKVNNLKDRFKTLIANDPNYLIQYFISDKAVFQDYIDVIVSVMHAVHELRTVYLIENYGTEYPRKYSERDSAYERYPLRIMEIARIELAL